MPQVSSKSDERFNFRVADDPAIGPHIAPNTLQRQRDLIRGVAIRIRGCLV